MTSQSCPNCGRSNTSSEHIISCQAKTIQELKKELELKHRLSHYENSNTAPSKNSLIYKEMKRKRKEERQNWNASSSSSLSRNKKPGRKNGNLGVTQTFKPIGKPVIHSLDRFPKCNSTIGHSIMSTERRTVVDVPEPLPYDVREHIINFYRCSRCGASDLIPESAKKGTPLIICCGDEPSEFNCNTRKEHTFDYVPPLVCRQTSSKKDIICN